MQPRVRFAPSPTGDLHIGGARTALFNFLFAKNQQGSLILRIEDTDQERSTVNALQSQLRDLAWLGIEWDEGIGPDGITESGKFGPYKQSQRISIYKKYLQQLLDNDLAYYCFLTPEEIEQQKQNCINNKIPYRPTSKYRNITKQESIEKLKSQPNAAIRFKSPKTAKNYIINDIVRGEVKFNSDQAGDFVIQRSNGMPMYNFCCVVDDYLMQITHVFRGEEHLTNTLKQLMLYDAFNFQPPKFAHTSVILGTSGKKLSKRDGAVSCHHYKQEGYLASAVLNYIALLGWNDGTEQEFFSKQELIEKFSLDKLNPSSPIFDQKKLTWINHKHIQNTNKTELWHNLKNHVDIQTIPQSYPENWGEIFTEYFAENFNTLKDAQHLFRVLTIKEPNYDNAKEVLMWENSIKVVNNWLNALENLNDNITQDWFKKITQDLQTNLNTKGKFLFMPLRVAMIAEPQGAELKLLIQILPKQTLIDRARSCLKFYEQTACK